MSGLYFRSLVLLILLLSASLAKADISRGGVLNQVADRFLNESSLWAAKITDHASWLFWTLVAISMVWTFAMLALRKADIQEFFAELFRFIIFTGFFWWLLVNGPVFAISIIDSLRTIAAEASGLARGLNPSTPIDIAFDIVSKAAKSYSVTSPIDNISIFFTTLAILACMAVVAANVLLALVSAWVIAYAGIFVLGFGGSRWTSDIAINYFRSVLGIALKLMTITLLVGITVSIIDGYHSDLSGGAPLDELLVIFVVSLVLVILINSVPNVVAGLVPGGSSAASSGSSFGAGALLGSAVGAGSAVAAGAAVISSGVTSAAVNTAGGASAIKAAIEKAQATGMGGDMPDSMYSSDSADGSSFPFAKAAGMATSTGFTAAGELIKGIGENMADQFSNQVDASMGGRVASTIRESTEAGENTVSGTSGWQQQSGGFSQLSDEDKADAMGAYTEWQAQNPGQDSKSIEDFVADQQMLTEESSNFVYRTH